MKTVGEFWPAARALKWGGALTAMSLFGTTASSTVWSQDSVAALQLPEVVVSASRIELPAERVGSAVTVITAEDLERNGQQFVSDVLRDVPGVAVNRSGAAGALTQVRIRGSEGNHTLVIIDGIEVNDQSAGSEYDFSRLLTEDIERIEVLRGSQSALFGSDAIGGVISITTKRGSEGFSGSVSAEGGSFRTGKGSASLRYGGEHFNISGSATRFRTDGISNASEARGATENDGYENDTLSFNGAVFPMEWLTVDGSLRATKAFFETDGFAGGVGAFDRFSDTTTRQRYGRIGIELDPFAGTWTHRFDAAYSSDEDDNRNNGALTSFSDGTKRKYAYQTTVSFDTPSVALAEHDVTLLAESEKDTMQASFLAQGTIDTTNNALAGEYNLGLFEQLFLSGSLRYDQNDRFENEKTYRLSAAYLIEGWGTRFHASFGTGVKNPTLTELFGFANNFVGNPNLTPERAKSWDAGVEQKFWGDRAVLDVTVFRSDVEDLITGSGNTAVNLDGVSEARGVEVSAKLALADNLDLLASYTWTHAETADGTEQVRRPTNLASVNLNYRFLQDKANLNLGVDYNGSFTDFAFDANFNRSIVEMSSFALVNLNGSYRIADGVHLFARGENLLDQDYEEVFTFGTPGISGFAGMRWTF